MLTRKIPYLGASAAYIRENVRSGVIRPSTKPMVDPAFVPLVKQAWSQDPSKRGTLTQLRAMLEEAAGRVDPDTQIGELRPPPRQSRRISTHTRVSPPRTRRAAVEGTVTPGPGRTPVRATPGGSSSPRGSARKSMSPTARRGPGQLFGADASPARPQSTPGHGNRSRRRVQTESALPSRALEASRTPLLQPMGRGALGI